MHQEKVYRVSLLHVSDEMQFPRNEASNNAQLPPIAFTSNSLTCVESCYSNAGREALCTFHGLENFTTNVLQTK